MLGALSHAWTKQVRKMWNNKMKKNFILSKHNDSVIFQMLNVSDAKKKQSTESEKYDYIVEYMIVKHMLLFELSQLITWHEVTDKVYFLFGTRYQNAVGKILSNSFMSIHFNYSEIFSLIITDFTCVIQALEQNKEHTEYYSRQ